MNLETITLIGFGNVGSHLYKRLLEKGIALSHVVSRTIPEHDFPASTIVTSSLENLPVDQLTIVCVPDGEIARIIQQLPEQTPVAYTSGSVILNSLPSRSNIGVFYPLQTFSKGREVRMSDVPFFIEANSEIFAQKLYKLAQKISDNVHFSNSEERKKMHLAAVWVNNFTNHILTLAKAYADQENVDFEHLKPLLEETIRKLDDMSPWEAQTGPARRGDQKTIESHLSALQGTPRELYALISKSISEAYSK